jgi:phi13 family phage major tail protein
MPNKIKYGLKNVYYAKITEGTGGALTYATPVAIPGAVSLSLDAQGDVSKFYADNIVYYQTVSNGGYEGDLEVALIPDSFRTDILNEVQGTNGMIAEYSDRQPSAFALLFQFEGDVNATRHVLYNCIATRPAAAGQTKEESVEPQTSTMTISAAPRSTDSLVKASCEASATAYANWFTAVQEPVAGE